MSHQRRRLLGPSQVARLLGITPGPIVRGIQRGELTDYQEREPGEEIPTHGPRGYLVDVEETEAYLRRRGTLRKKSLSDDANVIRDLLDQLTAAREQLQQATQEARARAAQPSARSAYLGNELGGSGYGRDGAVPPRVGENSFPLRTPRTTQKLTTFLPQGFVTLQEMARLHHVPDGTVQDARKGGRLPVEPGRWQRGRHYITHALAPRGQEVFFQLWGHRADFVRCPDCPHTIAVPKEPSEDGSEDDGEDGIVQ